MENAKEINDFRVARLRAAIDRLTHGDQTAFGRLLGYKDGAFIRHMLTGRRPVSEKTVMAIEQMPGMTGWFAQDREDKIPTWPFRVAYDRYEAMLPKEKDRLDDLVTTFVEGAAPTKSPKTKAA